MIKQQTPKRAMADSSGSAGLPRQRRFFGGTRTRILAWYFLLTAFSTIASFLVTQQIFYRQLEYQGEQLVRRKIRSFELIVEERQQLARAPFQDDLDAILETWFSRYRYIPENMVIDDSAIAITNGHITHFSPQTPPELLSQNPDLMPRLASTTQPVSGKIFASDGTFIYMATPILLGGKVQGVMVIVYCTNSAVRMVDRAVLLVVQVTLAVLTVAAIMAWVTAGRVLAPLRSLNETVRTITESDMRQRIVVEGSDEIAELTANFNEMLDRLQTAFDSQQEFINNASHELRTPITIIQGHLELLKYYPERQPETIDLLLDELSRMSRLVNDLLLLAKAERPDFLHLKPHDLDWLTEELYLKARVMADRDWQLESKGLSPIVVDRQRLTQAVMNLVQNAIRHTQEGDTIRLGSSVRNGYAYCWVQDTGEGIAPEDQTRIFERFVRVLPQQPTAAQLEGFGLGLSIVQAIVHAHGGWVELSSHPGEGSTFTLVIPLVPSNEAGHESNSDSRRQSSRYLLPGSRPASQRIHDHHR